MPKKLFNLPNKLTLSRIVAVPAIVVLLWYQTKISCLLAVIVFGLASLTDLADGYFARKGNQVTSFGKFLDPLADKILVCSVLIMLVELGWVAAWVAIVIICRDIMVTGLRAIAADEGIVITADRYGKLKTILQMLALAPLILHFSWFGINMHGIGQVLLYIAIFLTVFSGCNYFIVFFKNWQIKLDQASK